MKKSEMILVIEKTINKVYDLCPLETEMFANEILENMEEAGMLPPEFESVETSEFIKGDFFMTRNEWEKEDD